MGSSNFRAKTRRGRGQRGSMLLLYTLMLPVVLLPMVGLAIDVTMLYIVQAKLSAACDGAALGAGRLLGTTANTNEIAGEFLTANFPANYWGSFNFVPTISSSTTLSTHTITVTAAVNVPLLFLRLLGQNSSLVTASAMATRRDTRVVMVLDRSYSMINVMGALRTSAATFTTLFSPSADELGLVVFGGSAFVAYPTTRPYSLVTGTGPNVHFADTPAPGGDNMLTLINAMQVGTDTGTAEGLWLAYQELKKANAIDQDPTKLNAIVLFTDGVPNGFTAFFNNPANNGANNVLGANSRCTYNPAVANDSTTNMIGWMATAGQASNLSFFDPNSSTGIGVYPPLIFDARSAKYWMSTVGGNGYVNDMTELAGKPMTNCQHIGANGSLGPGTDMSGLTRIPPVDYYGNSTSGTAYSQGVLYQKYGLGYDPTKPSNGYHVGLASWNLVDNTAQAILKDATMNVAIYCIGYTGNGGVDAALLKRVANTQDATSYNANYQTGMYVQADDATGMANAFNTVGSEILRLAK